jgi:hypothetical protein
MSPPNALHGYPKVLHSYVKVGHGYVKVRHGARVCVAFRVLCCTLA